MAVVKDMVLTLEGFLRDLEAALAGLDYRVEGSRVEATNGTGRITITLEPLPPRRLSGLLSLPPRRLSGLLSLARSKVTIAFEDYDEAAEAAFVEHFDRVYRRGGG